MKISDLKLGYLRRTIQVDLEGKTQEVNIFNILRERRNEIINDMLLKQESGLSEADIVNEMYSDIFFECTDLEIDEDIIEVLNSPSSEMIVVMSEINEIIHELQCEMIMNKISELNQMEQFGYTQLMLAKSEKITKVMEDIRIASPDKSIEGE